MSDDQWFTDASYRIPFRRIFEFVSGASALSFILSGLYNWSVFITWHLNYFQIATPSDVIMSSFIAFLVVGVMMFYFIATSFTTIAVENDTVRFDHATWWSALLFWMFIVTATIYFDVDEKFSSALTRRFHFPVLLVDGCLCIAIVALTAIIGGVRSREVIQAGRSRELSNFVTKLTTTPAPWISVAIIWAVSCNALARDGYYTGLWADPGKENNCQLTQSVLWMGHDNLITRCGKHIRVIERLGVKFATMDEIADLQLIESQKRLKAPQTSTKASRPS